MIESFTSVFVSCSLDSLFCAVVLSPSSSKFPLTVFHSQAQLSDHLHFVSVKQLRVVSLFEGLKMPSFVKLFCNIRFKITNDKE